MPESETQRFNQFSTEELKCLELMLRTGVWSTKFPDGMPEELVKECQKELSKRG